MTQEKKEPRIYVQLSNTLVTENNVIVSNGIIIKDGVYELCSNNPKKVHPCLMCELRHYCQKEYRGLLCEVFNAKSDEFYRQIGEIRHPF